MTVRYERDDHVAVITLDRPERGNSLDHETLEVALPEAWVNAREDSSVGAIVLTAAGDRFFCTGVDVTDPVMVEIATGRREPFAMRATGRQNDVWKPIVTAVNGKCVGGALMFVADSDIVIGSSAASFTNPGVSIGIAAHVGAAVLTHTADFRAILRMSLLGRHEQLDADAAHRAGIISEVLPPAGLRSRALELAHLIASNSPAGLADALHTLWGALGTDADGARVMANDRAERFREHPDAAEGVAALREGRVPVWDAYRSESHAT